MNSITRSLNIGAILTKNKDQKQTFLSIKLHIWLTHARSPCKVNTVKEVAKIYIKMMFKTWKL